MAGHPLRSATDRRLGGPLPHQLPNQTRIHLTPPEFFTLYHAVPCAYAVLAVISNCYPPVWGRLSTRYSPVRRSVNLRSIRKLHLNCFARLACVKHAASVHPEPGSNSHVKKLISVKLNLANSFIQVANKFATVRSSSNNSASRLFSSLSHKFWIYCFKGLQFSLKRSDWFSKSFKVSHCSVINVLCFALLRQLDYFIKSLFVFQALFYFFELCFKFSVLRQLVYSIKMFFICQELFS